MQANIVLEPGDIIYVPKTGALDLQRGGQYAGSLYNADSGRRDDRSGDQTMTQEEGDLSLRDFFSILRRRRRELLFCWVTIFGIILAYTELVTPLFRAQVLFRVQVEDPSNHVDLGALSVLAQPAQQFNLEQLLSPQILEDTVRHIRNVDSIPDHEMAVAVQQLQRRVAVQFSENDRNLVILTVTSPLGRDAAIQANELSLVMVQQVTEDSTIRAQKTRKFITDQLEEVQTRLRDSENKLSQKQEKTGAQSVGQILISRLLDLRNRQAILARKFTASYPELKEINAEIRNTGKAAAGIAGPGSRHHAVDAPGAIE